jgi:hypothetical protein
MLIVAGRESAADSAFMVARFKKWLLGQPSHFPEWAFLVSCYEPARMKLGRTYIK